MGGSIKSLMRRMVKERRILEERMARITEERKDLAQRIRFLDAAIAIHGKSDYFSALA